MLTSALIVGCNRQQPQEKPQAKQAPPPDKQALNQQRAKLGDDRRGLARSPGVAGRLTWHLLSKTAALRGVAHVSRHRTAVI